MNYKNYETKTRDNGSIQISKIRDTKDKASYYWALSDNGSDWKVIKDKKAQYNISGDTQQVIDMLVKLNKPIHPEAVKLKHISFKKHAEPLVLTRSGNDVIFIGSSKGKSRKAKIYTFAEAKENIGYVLDLEDRPDILVNQESLHDVTYAEGELKIMDDCGVVKIIKGKQIHVYEKNDEIYIKIGLTEKAKKKQSRTDALANNGVWRAD